MCCRSWKSILPFALTFLIGVFAVNAFVNTNKVNIKALNNFIDSDETSNEYSKAPSELERKNCSVCGCGFGSEWRKGDFDARGVYTAKARRNKIEGMVKLNVTLLSSGKIGEVFVINGLPDGLTEQAIKAAKAIKFEPQKVNNVPKTVTLEVNYLFTLK